MPNFIKYSQMVAEITHLGFLNGEHSPFLDIFKIQIFNDWGG